MRSTHTYVILEIDPEAYEEIAAKLRAAGYDHAFGPDGEIDMHGIAIAPDNDAIFRTAAAARATGRNVESAPYLGMTVMDVSGREWEVASISGNPEPITGTHLCELAKHRTQADYCVNIFRSQSAPGHPEIDDTLIPWSVVLQQLPRTAPNPVQVVNPDKQYRREK